MSYQAVTLAQLQGQLASRTDSHPWWTAEQARLALNEGLRIWNAATGAWVTKLRIPVVPRDPYVPVPSAIGPSMRVLWNGVPLEKGSLADLDYGVPNWRAGVAGESGQPDRPVYWAPVGLHLFVIYPAMSSALFPSTLEVAGIRRTPVLLTAGDFVDLGEETHDVLLDYALHVLTFSMGGQRFAATTNKWLAFLAAAGAENRQFAATAAYRRILGLDLQRRLRPQERQTQTPVEGAVARAAEQMGGD